jgi:hypothetical protein
MNVTVSNTNGVKDNKSYVRVYVNSVKVAEVSPKRRNPLGYLRQYKNSKYWGEIRVQLESYARAGMFTLKEVSTIMEQIKGVSNGS